MRAVFWLVAGAATLTACESAVEPTAPVEVAFSHAPTHPGVLVEGAWGDGQLWEMVKPRPPGLGNDPSRATPLYIIAPLDPGAPLSPEIDLPGVVRVGGRDHVVPVPAGNRGSFSGTARSVPLEVPGWTWWIGGCEAVPFDARIAWDWVEVSLHPCGRVAVVYAVQLAGEPCPLPLTSVARAEAALAQGVAVPSPVEEDPWPFAIRPVTQQGQGRTRPAAPTGCVAAGPR